MCATEALLEERTSVRPVSAAGRPIFRWDRDAYAIFYTPGYVCVVDLPNAQRFEQMLASAQVVDGWKPLVKELRQRAELAAAREQGWHEASFDPVCLTLYMNNACNLRCVYCYADPARYPLSDGVPSQRHVDTARSRGRGRETWLDIHVIAAAARTVARNCRRRGVPSWVVFHGGGEPTLDRERVEQALSLLDRETAAQGIECFRYVSTNGVMPEKKAVWLARNFDLVGLSCDGPADIQNGQRPLWDGGSTAQSVERTAHIMRAEGQKVHVRVTVARENVHRQAEIVAYACETLFPAEIHLEPVYVGGRAALERSPDALAATAFVRHFLQAHRTARRYGIPLIYAGCRLEEIHGPYCNLMRDVLNLVPGGVATACFKETQAQEARAKGMAIGAMDEETGHFAVDAGRVQALRQRLIVSLARCHACFNRFHCARACPDICALADEHPGQSRWLDGSFRCQVQRALALAELQEHAQAVWSQTPGHDKDATVYGKAVV